MNQYVVVEGIIGAGKTSLATKLAHDFSSRLILEEFADNPFLPKFYEEPKRYSFPLELSFLSERFAQLKNEFQRQDLFQPQIIADYFLPKCQIFAKNNLEEDEYKLFLRLFEIMQGNVPNPNLLVYLYLSPEKALENIRKRGRTYEQSMELAYLENIQQQYLSFINQHPQLSVLIIATDSLDFVNNETDYQLIKALVSKTYSAGIHRVEP